MQPLYRPLTREQRLRLGARLRALRVERRLSATQVARELFGNAWSQAAIVRAERGVLASVSQDTLDRLSRLYAADLRNWLDEYLVTQFVSTDAATMGPPEEVATRVLQLADSLHFDAHPALCLREFAAALAPVTVAKGKLSACPDLDGLDRVSRAFNLTKSWLPEGR
jgi:transcriptional regulator with XRE-family HTH domain